MISAYAMLIASGAALSRLATSSVSAQTFSADSQIGGFEPPTEALGAPNQQNNAIEETDELMRPSIRSIGTLPRICECSGSNTINVSDIRTLSDTWCKGGGAADNSFGMSNMVWAWGQVVDHDIVATVDTGGRGPTYTVPINGRDMVLHRAQGLGGTCTRPFNTQSGRMDGGPVYGTNRVFESSVLRMPDSCRLREGAPGLLPVTTKADSEGRFFLLAGDSRVDEHAVLTSFHTILLREHNRICDEIENVPELAGASPDKKYAVAKARVIATMQQITLNEFLPALGVSKAEVEAAQGLVAGAETSVEFSIAYRLGHTLIPNKVGSFAIAELFDGQAFFLDKEAGGAAYISNADAQIDMIMKALATNKASEIDGKMSDALRDILFGPANQEDLCSRNIFRGRDLSVPSYAGLAECLGVTPDAAVEAETPDLWLGLLREPKAPGKPLGPTLLAILKEQFHRIFFGPQGMFWATALADDTLYFKSEIESVTLAKLVSANTDVVLTGNAFKV